MKIDNIEYIEYEIIRRFILNWIQLIDLPVYKPDENWESFQRGRIMILQDLLHTVREAGYRIYSEKEKAS